VQGPGGGEGGRAVARDSRIRSAALPVGAARAMEAASTPASVRAASTARTIDVLPVPGPPETTVTRRSRTRSTAWRCASFRVAGTVGVASGGGAVEGGQARSQALLRLEGATGRDAVVHPHQRRRPRRWPDEGGGSLRQPGGEARARLRRVEPQGRPRLGRRRHPDPRRAPRQGLQNQRGEIPERPPGRAIELRYGPRQLPREVRLVRPEARTLGPLRQRWQPPIAPQARRPPGAAVRMPVRAHHAAAIWG
jgi:hypothetical protein